MFRDSAEGKTCTWCHLCREPFVCEDMVYRALNDEDYALFCEACAKQYDEARALCPVCSQEES